MPTVSDIDSLGQKMAVEGEIDLKTFFVYMAREFRDAGSESEKRLWLEMLSKLCFKKMEKHQCRVRPYSNYEDIITLYL